jgi:hypothetical protein
MTNGILKYTEAKVSIFFEPDHVSCQFCPMLETYARNQCRRTGEYIVDTRVRGRYCPLVIEEDSSDDL